MALAPAVAIVVITQNRALELLATLERLAALPERPEVIVVDNASTDDTPLRVASRFPDVKVIALDINLGAAGRNVGVQATTCPYVAFADDDSWWAPGALATAVALFERTPRLGLLAGRILVGPDERLDPVCRAMSASPIPSDPDAPGPAILGFVACGAIVRRAAFLAVGGFSARFGVGGEESVVAYDLAAHGWLLAYVDEVVAHHHPSPARNPALRKRRLARNALWTAWLRRRPLEAAMHTAKWARLALSDPLVRAGMLDATREIGQIWQERKPLPPTVERALKLVD